jgi:hypothetical protein
MRTARRAVNSSDTILHGARMTGAHQLPPDIRAAVERRLATIADERPRPFAPLPVDWQLDWTGFGLEAGGAQFRVAHAIAPYTGFLKRRQRAYCVYGARVGEPFPREPLSMHSSLALAAETLLLIFSDICKL